jgi:FkbM family methyltransferase
LIKKLYKIFKEQGIFGFSRILRIQILLILYKIEKFFNIKNYRTFFGNLKLVANWNDENNKIYYCGSEGNYLANYLLKYSEYFTFLDVGANIGYYSILSAKNAKCLKVYSFEPIKELSILLINNSQLNNTENKINILNKAITNVNGYTLINYNKDSTGLSSIDNKIKDSKPISIETTNHEGFNELIDLNKKNLIVKIDTEGDELIVIKELLKSNLNSLVNEIIYEIDERWTDPRLVKNILVENGFNSFKKIGFRESHYDIHAFRNY